MRSPGPACLPKLTRCPPRSAPSPIFPGWNPSRDNEAQLRGRLCRPPHPAWELPRAADAEPVLPRLRHERLLGPCRPAASSMPLRGSARHPAGSGRSLNPLLSPSRSIHPALCSAPHPCSLPGQPHPPADTPRDRRGQQALQRKAGALSRRPHTTALGGVRSGPRAPPPPPAPLPGPVRHPARCGVSLRPRGRAYSAWCCPWAQAFRV